MLTAVRDHRCDPRDENYSPSVTERERSGRAARAGRKADSVSTDSSDHRIRCANNRWSPPRNNSAASSAGGRVMDRQHRLCRRLVLPEERASPGCRSRSPARWRCVARALPTYSDGIRKSGWSVESPAARGWRASAGGWSTLTIGSKRRARLLTDRPDYPWATTLRMDVRKVPRGHI